MVSKVSRELSNEENHFHFTCKFIERKPVNLCSRQNAKALCGHIFLSVNFMCMGIFCMYVCVPVSCLKPADVREGCQIPGAWGD